MDVREQQSALELLTSYPSPARVAQEPEAVKSLLHKASRSKLSEEAVTGVLAGNRKPAAARRRPRDRASAA
jgi:hypothetical protein